VEEVVVMEKLAVVVLEDIEKLQDHKLVIQLVL
jgi:hypothetical protein